MTLEISCVEVWREISDYLDGNIDAELRTRIEAHFKACKHCSAVYDGTRNVVRLIGDGRAFEVPASFSKYLYDKLPKR
jgi:anti-sigma factor (TIGR02949 family)